MSREALKAGRIEARTPNKPEMIRYCNSEPKGIEMMFTKSAGIAAVAANPKKTPMETPRRPPNKAIMTASQRTILRI